MLHEIKMNPSYVFVFFFLFVALSVEGDDFESRLLKENGGMDIWMKLDYSIKLFLETTCELRGKQEDDRRMFDTVKPAISDFGVRAYRFGEFFLDEFCQHRNEIMSK